MIGRFFYTCFLFIFFQTSSSGQSLPVTDNHLAQSYNFIRPVFNRIMNTAGLDSFYSRLYQLKTGGQRVVSIVHIGDSHVQADFLPAVLRDGLQQFFGNAGRGLIFPYQLARSNAPQDIHSHSSTNWQFNRLAHPEIPINYGVSGYGLRTNAGSASISFSLKAIDSGTQTFNRIKLFLTSDEPGSWAVRGNDNDSVFFAFPSNDSLLYKEITLRENTTNFWLGPNPFRETKISGYKEFYGVSLENSSPGILYHSIGVNGARYDHYNKADLFWKQLPVLKADLFIVSLGTNEAQNNSFNETIFLQQVSLLLEKLKEASPNAAILITTAADSYKQRRPNAVLKKLNLSLVNYCNQQHIPVLDLYGVTNGYGSAYSWSKRKLMSRDRIHFTAEGYRIQGSLLFSALAKGYNNYTELMHE